METIYYFLPFIVFLGIITSYEDIKFHKIRNRWLTLAVLSSILINMTLIIYFGKDINKNYYFDLLINAAIAIIIAFLLFYFDIWSMGDGKLFFAYSVLIPITSYSVSYIKYFPGFALLTNIFLPYLIYMIIKLIVFHLMIKSVPSLDKKIIFESIKELFGKKMFFSILKLFSISWIISILLENIGVSNTFVVYGLSLLVYSFGLRFIENKYEKIVIYSSLIISLTRVVFDKTVYALNFWVYFLLFVIIIMIVFQSLLMKMITRSSIIYLNKKELKEGLTLAYPIIKTKKGFLLNENLKESIDEKIIFLKIDTILDEKEIKSIMRSKISFKIAVYQKIPFAHIMFIGALITIIIKGNLLIYLINIFK